MLLAFLGLLKASCRRGVCSRDVVFGEMHSLVFREWGSTAMPSLYGASSHHTLLLLTEGSRRAGAEVMLACSLYQ